MPSRMRRGKSRAAGSIGCKGGMADLTLDREQLQIVFDVAVGSLDFGSGFLDDEEVAGLRAVAVVLGVDPMDATPSNFMCKYGAEHNWYEWEATRRCVRCSTVEGS